MVVTNKLFFFSNNFQRASPKQWKILPCRLILHFAVNPPDATQIYFSFLHHALDLAVALGKIA
jgi:hypothetical protein